MEQYGQYNVTPASEMMMLGVGQPSPYYLSQMKKFVFSSEELDIDTSIFQYGRKQGFESYLELIKKLTFDYTKFSMNTKYLYMTNGVSQAVFMLSSLFRSKYDTIFVEELTYFIMINIFKDLKYNIKTFSLNKLDIFEEELKNYNNGVLIYLIPFCNNPTGKTMKKNEQKKFINILENNYKCICISDETYQFLHFAQDNTDNDYIDNKPFAIYNKKIISLGTFSKIFAPAVRLGWLYTYLDCDGTDFCDYLNDTGFLDSGGSVNPLMAYIITKQITKFYDSFNNMISTIINGLQTNLNIVINTLDKHKNYFEYIKPNGGYFIFVKSLKLKSQTLLKLALESGISFHVGNKFAPDNNYDEWFRLSLSYYTKEDFEKYFSLRINNLVKLIDLEIQKNNILGVSLFGNGKLGILINNLLKQENIKYNVLTRNFYNENIGDIIIDVTTSQATINLINFLTEKKINKKLIIGTTGFTDEDLNIIKNYSIKNAVILCPNFSDGIQNMIKMIRNLDKVWKIANIIDIHHIHKKDSPSGTALLLKKELEKKEIITNIESRREGEVIGTHTIILNGKNEQITLSHNAENRNIFAKGCINLIEKIKKIQYGLYDFI